MDELIDELANIFWITPLITQQEKKNYCDVLKYYIKFYDDITQAIEALKQLQIFTETFIIIDEKFYVNFILLFIKNFEDIILIPKLLLFTNDKEQFIKDNQEYAYFINHPFYNFNGKNIIKSDIYQIRKLIENLKKENKINYNEYYRKSDNDNPCYNFEYIDSDKKLGLPKEYSSLKRKPQQYEIEKFNHYLLNNYTTRKVGLYIFTTDIPIELLSKYYIYLYTGPNFHDEMNNYLSRDIKDYSIHFFPYIQVLYEAVRMQILPVSKDKILYRGDALQQYEIDTIYRYLEKKNQYLHGAIVFAKKFLSFSKKKSLAKDYMNHKKNLGKRVLYVLEKEENIDCHIASHSVVGEISAVQQEEEVLYFPFSCFEIISVIKTSEAHNEYYYEIRLKSLDKFLYNFLSQNTEKTKDDNINIIINEKNEFINKLMKDIENLKEENKTEYNQLKQDIENLKEKFKNEINQLKKERDNIKDQLTKTKWENIDLINKMASTKTCFTIRSRCALDKCLDSKNLSYGNSPHLWEYSENNKNQIFEIEKNGDGTYSIKNSASGLYLGIDPDKISFRKRNENSQSFKIRHLGDGYYLFEEKCGAVIDLGNYKTHNGATIGKCRLNYSEAQQWKLVVHL